MFEWSDLQHFLAVIRAGSTLGAARRLGVNQTTVARRIAALEAQLGIRLFDRAGGRYCLNEAGGRFRAAAERVEAEALNFERLVAQHGRQLAGVIRVTTNEAIANTFLTPWIGEFMGLYPDIRIEVMATDSRLDLLRGEADIALRAGVRPTEPGLVARKLSDVPWAIYGSSAYMAREGVPAGICALRSHRLIGAEGPLALLEPMRWFADSLHGTPFRSACSSLTNLLVAVRSGLGLAPLPCMMEYEAPELVRCFMIEGYAYGLYLVMPEALRDAPRIRTFSAFIAARTAALRHVMEGRMSAR